MFWEPNETLVDFCGFSIPNVDVSFLENEMECHDFMENFAFGLCMGNFAFSVLCKVLRDMIYSKLDFISETKSLFGLAVSATQFSVSITHNSKMVGPIAKRLFRKSITLFP